MKNCLFFKIILGLYHWSQWEMLTIYVAIFVTKYNDSECKAFQYVIYNYILALNLI